LSTYAAGFIDKSYQSIEIQDLIPGKIANKPVDVKVVTPILFKLG